MTWGSWSDPKWLVAVRAFQGDMVAIGLRPARLPPSLLTWPVYVGIPGATTFKGRVIAPYALRGAVPGTKRSAV